MRRVRLLTWNVGRLYTPTDNNRLADDDVPRVARVVRELDADVVLLQEFATPRQLDALLARLPEYHGRLAERCRYDRRVAALARASLAPDFEQHLLDETGRGLVAVIFDAGASRAMALAVHFDVFRPWRRRSQLRQVAALVDERRERLGLADADSFRLLSTRLADVGRGAGPTLMGLLRVDHLLAGGALVDRAYARVSPNRRLPLGDHDPLVVDVHLRAHVDAAARTS